MKRAAIFAIISATVPYVAAHGFVSQVVIDGKAYAGNVPNNYKGPSPIRLISDISPVKGASNPDLNCGLNAQLAELVVPANPGSTVEFQWSGGAGQKWPHNTGPLMTYLASCGDTTCDKFDSANAEFFKIDETGKKPGSSQWVQQDIMNGDSFTVTLPKDLAPGDYLIRHEIIALHLAVSKGGAEFYPSCTQIRVGGSATGQLSGDSAKFPGGYSDTDPGIFDPSVFDDNAKYAFPGPAISTLATSDASGSSSPPASATPSFPAEGASATGTGAGSGSATSATHVASPSASAGTGATGAAASAGSKGQCKLKKSAAKNATANVNMPRHYSRVMRRIMHSS